MEKKTLILIAGFILLAAAGIVLFCFGRASVRSYPQLQGEWSEVNSTSPEQLSFRKGNILYRSGEEEKKCSYTVTEGESYVGNLENALTISFPQEDGPWYGELVYHTQLVDGHSIRILSSFLYEDDGRGLIVFVEFVHNDDLAYVDEDFSSDLYHRLNDCEAVPTYAYEGDAEWIGE